MKKIQINHIGKMEGHADFVAEILKGDVLSAKIITTEGARLIEGILVGRHFQEAPVITSRICGICPVVHKLSAIKAIEHAFDLKPSRQTVQLRKLLLLAQIIHSHALHLFFLSLPDFHDIENDLRFIDKYSKETESAIKVRQWALEIIEVIGGRAVHPIACEVGGFKVLPSAGSLKKISEEYDLILKNALVLTNLVMDIKYPKMSRPTTFISLTASDEYALYHGNLKISRPGGETKIIPAKQFTKNIKEIEEPYRAAKTATLAGEPFMVGALARLNNNHQQMRPLASGLLRGLRWRWPQYNTFENITAQAIEIVHCLEEAKVILDQLAKSLKPEKSLGRQLKVIAGANPRGVETTGIDAIEAPRGTLYHSYSLDRNGYISRCQIITPTVSFLKNLEEDIKVYLPQVMKLNPERRAKKIRALIRAYDPCIACATH